MLLSTYAEVREQSNLVLVVGGGIGTPERGADYITGECGYVAKRMEVGAVVAATPADHVRRETTVISTLFPDIRCVH